MVKSQMDRELPWDGLWEYVLGEKLSPPKGDTASVHASGDVIIYFDDLEVTESGDKNEGSGHILLGTTDNGGPPEKILIWESNQSTGSTAGSSVSSLSGLITDLQTHGNKLCILKNRLLNKLRQKISLRANNREELLEKQEVCKKKDCVIKEQAKKSNHTSRKQRGELLEKDVLSTSRNSSNRRLQESVLVDGEPSAGEEAIEVVYTRRKWQAFLRKQLSKVAIKECGNNTKFRVSDVKVVPEVTAIGSKEHLFIPQEVNGFSLHANKEDEEASDGMENTLESTIDSSTEEESALSEPTSSENTNDEASSAFTVLGRKKLVLGKTSVVDSVSILKTKQVTKCTACKEKEGELPFDMPEKCSKPSEKPALAYKSSKQTMRQEPSTPTRIRLFSRRTRTDLQVNEGAMMSQPRNLNQGSRVAALMESYC